MKKTVLLALLTLCLANALQAKDVKRKHSLALFSVTSTRNIGMGGASFTCVDDSASLFINPSMMANLAKSGVSGSYSYTPYGDHKTLLTSAQKIGNFTLGIGLQSFVAAPVYLYKDEFTKNKSIYNELGFAVGGAYKIGSTLIGGNIRGIYTGSFSSDMKDDFGMTLDFAVTTPVVLPLIRASIGIKNFGFYQNTFAPFDTDIVTGIGIMTGDGLLSAGLTASISVPSLTPSVAFGAEYLLIPFGKSENGINIDDDPESILDAPPPVKTLDGIKVRAGVSDKNFSFGAGLYVGMFRLDYAMSFEDYSFKYYTHSVSLGFVF